MAWRLPTRFWVKDGREKKLETKWDTVQWHSQFGLFIADIRLLAEVEPSFPAPELASQLSTARAALIAASAKARLFIWAVIAFLLLTHFGIPLPISVAGLTLEAGPGVQEVAILAVSLATTWAWTRALSFFFVGEALRRVIDLDKRQDDLPSLRHFIFHPEDPPPISFPKMQPYLYWHHPAAAVQAIKVLMLFAVIAGVTVASVWWRVVIYGQVWAFPTIDEWWSHAIVVGVVLLDAGTLLYAALHFIPLPFKNYEVAQGYNAISDSNPELARLVAIDRKGGDALARDFLARFRR